MTFAPQGAIDHIFILPKSWLTLRARYHFDLPVTCCLHTATSCWHQSFQSGKKAQTELRKTLLRHLSVSSVFLTLTAYIHIYEQTAASYGEQGVESNSGQQWPTYTCHLLVWKKPAAEGNISPSLCTLVCILLSSPGSRWRNERRSATASALRWNLCKQRWKRGLGR